MQDLTNDFNPNLPTSIDRENDGILRMADWSDWHDEYENEGSELNARKRAVQAQVVAVVDQCPPGPVTIVSICGGQGREVIGALEGHERRADVRGRIVELDTKNAAFARAWAQKVQLGNLEVLAGDASLAESYQGLAAVDLVVISGVFGHINNADRMRLIGFLRQICRKGACVVWTSVSWGDGKIESLRKHFLDNMFEEESFETLAGKFAFTIAKNRYVGEPVPFEPHAKFFSFGSSRDNPDEAAQ
ncbi:hypothetical protein SAMN05444678_11772 [Sphingomonas sp. YR710]|nr:hypothetical protein SAMN05444678_11772 [Sphingomonas sp. YR710]